MRISTKKRRNPYYEFFLIFFVDITNFLSGTGREARTPDTWFWRPVLYQLSYSRVFSECKGKAFFWNVRYVWATNLLCGRKFVLLS